MPRRPLVVPIAFDLAAYVAFVALGRGEHHVDKGVDWFLTVLWPLALGWFVVAFVIGLYTRPRVPWTRWAITWIGGVIVGTELRVVFTGRSGLGVFTVVTAAFIGLFTGGWRAIRAALISRKGARFSR